MRRVADSSFLVVANGAPDSPPASGVRDYLVRHAHDVTAVFHPLNAGDPPIHHIVRWRDGEEVARRVVRRPSRPPLTYLLDAFTPFSRPTVDAWLGFSNLSSLLGIARRRLGLVGRVAYWAVDFVPDRFGRGSPLTLLYDRIDRIVATRADLRVELTTAARDARSARLSLEDGAAPTSVAPVGVWLDRLPRVPADGWRRRRVVFIGHLVPRQGAATLLRAVALLPGVELDVAGRGPEEQTLRRLAAELGIASRVSFHGFLADHQDVERLLAAASVAAAPYAADTSSFTRYADPSKLRSYTGAGLPIVLTDVPPNARELEHEAGAIVVDDTPEAVADAIRGILETPDGWSRRRALALRYASRFDWGQIVPPVLARLGFE